MGAIVRDGEGRLLLVRRGHPPGEGLWSLPGGRVEPGESDGAAVRRELREETGLEVAVGALAGVALRPPYEIYDYLATVVGGTLRAGDDAADAGWFDQAAFPPLTEGLRDTLVEWGIVTR
ncbi:NUDIX domain-containing protein [Streptosporangiaceae bacterium NEAU-GS5]|nr:NUDIX domain-containing protein [Streptosporangiaceae bacterium NEAU-GS5]